MVPSDPGDGRSGIYQVIAAYKRCLPAFGVEFVEDNSYDLLATHAGSMGAECDVAHNHGLYWTSDYGAPDWEYAANEQVVASLRNAKQVTVPSQWVAQVLRRDMRLDPHVVPHGIEWDYWQGGKSLGYVLYNKNRQGDVCDASPVTYLAERSPSLRFLSTFATAQLPNVTVTGVLPHEKMRDLVRGAAVYLAPTKETFGIGILEAMASGVPVVGYRHGGIVDLVRHGVNGYLAEPDDLEDLLAGLAYCLQYQRALGENGREMAQAYTWEKVAEQVAGVYRLAMIEEPPTVSIIIPTFNYAHLVGRAIESAISQTYDKLVDIIVVDDGSSDNLDITRYEEMDSRVRLLQQNNQGVANARNNGISLTNAKYICCLDADDWIDPEFLAVTVPYLEEDRTLGIAYTGLMMVGRDWEKPGSWPNGGSYDMQLKGLNQVPTCCVFRRSVWERLGGYRQRYAPGGCGTEDAEFWLRMGSVGYDARLVNRKPLFHYTLGGRTTGDGKYRETGWRQWHPWTWDRQHPFASVATPRNHSHPVRQYDDPIVSVVIPVGPGHEQHVVEALDSLDAQTFRRWEAVVVWDTGAEMPAPLQKAYPHVQWMETAGRTGAGHARNVGAERAVAPFLVFLDADDWLMPVALEAMLEAYGEEEAIVYSESYGVRAVDEETAREYEQRGELVKFENGIATVRQTVAEYNYELAIRQPFQDPPYFWCYVSSLIPKAWHDEIGGFDEALPAWEDWDYWIRLAKRGRPFVAVEHPLITYCYDSGHRREMGRGIKDELRAALIAKHEGVETMPCSSCGKRRTVRPQVSPPPAYAASQPVSERTIANMNDSDFVLVKYLPNRGGSHGVVGLTTFGTKIADNMRHVSGGWVFDYGHRTHGDVFLVHRADQQQMPNVFVPEQVPEAQRVLRLPSAAQQAPPPPPRAVAAKPEPQKVAPTPEPSPTELDLQQLPGVTPKLAERMREAGFTTKQAILDGDLTTVSGIGEAKAEAIKESLTVSPDVQSVLDELRKALGQ